MKNGDRDHVDRGRAEQRFRLDEPRSALRSPLGNGATLSFPAYVDALEAPAGAVNQAGDLLHANRALVRLLQASRGPERLDGAAPGFPPDVADSIRELANRALKGRAETQVRLRENGAEKLLSVVAAAFGSRKEPLIALSFQDLTRQVLVEQQAKQLMREVDHRVKNTLALVLSISNRTASSAETLDSFRSAFSGRMRALAAAHNTLAERSWSSIRFTDILAAELRPFGKAFEGRVQFSGLDAGLMPRAAVAIGLMLHELIANALRHGALSVPTGRVDLDLSCQPGYPHADLRWKESGGPRVATPARQGFGQAVITRSLQYSPHGGAEIAFLPDGVCCSMRVPVEDLA